MTSQATVLLTGATGFLGMEALARVLEQTDHDVVCLVRAADDAAAQERLDDVLRTLGAPGAQPHPGRVRAVAADLEAAGLGLSPAVRAELAGSVCAVMHCAASISFTLPIEEARRINVEGTREVVKLALEAQERGCLERFIHVSTAYVAGDRIGRVSEHDADVGQGFRNTYERTKLEAEEVVRDSGLPAAIVRPSVIVGDSETGWTQAFNVIYWPLQAFARGLFPTVPADPGACLDIVPVDVVADALLELLRGPVRGGAFHIVSGDSAPTNARLATMAAEAFDAEPPQFVRPGEDARAEQRAGALLPYFRVRCTFDARRARELLGATPPPLEDYFPSLMRYARDANWGKEPSPRWDAASAQRAA
ncbi:MAG TPA: SDR family oxidoreductase [Solirubrobacteraceae bacterium]|nr:SDR family oxidoreductase [Solirubrobacteraceae bacterium]